MNGPVRSRFNTHGLPQQGAQRALQPILDIRSKHAAADVIQLAAYPKDITTTNEELMNADTHHEVTNFDSLDLRYRDRRKKENLGLTWYSDFIVSNNIGLHNKRAYAHDYRYVRATPR